MTCAKTQGNLNCLIRKYMRIRSEYISIAIADDNIFYREGLQRIIEAHKIFSIKIVTDNCQSLLSGMSEVREPVDICILDISMPHSYETLKEIKRKYPDVKVLIMSLWSYELNIIRTIKIGANGFLLKESTDREIYEALVSIFNSGMYYSEVLPEENMHLQKDSLLLNLSYREMEYMSLCCTEMNQKAIAERMSVKVNTANSFRDSLFKKLNVNSRIGIVLFALRIGMLPTENAYQLTY